MSESEALPRPRQVTVAGGMAMVVAVLLVVSLFDAMSQVRSVETRTAVADYLADPSRAGLGVGVDQMLGALRVLVLVNGALAAAAVVLSVFVLRRHKAARIVLTVVAALLVCTAFVPTSGFFQLLLAMAVAMLWSAPARDWFAGRKPRPAIAGTRAAADGDRTPLQAWLPPAAQERLDDEAPEEPGPVQQPAPGQPPTSGRPPGPAPYPGAVPPPGPAPYPFGSPPAAAGYPQGGYPAQPAYQEPAYQEPGGYPAGGPSPGRRPGPVTAAAWMTWVFAGLTLGVYVLLLAVLVVARDSFLEALRSDPQVAQSNLSTENIVAALWVVGVIVAFWSLAAMVLAFLAYRRAGWARVTLMVSAVLTGLVAVLLTFFGSPVMLLHAVAAFTTVGLLAGGRVNAWYAGRGPGASSGGPGAPAPGPTYGGWPPPQGPPSQGPQPQQGPPPPQGPPQQGPQGPPEQPKPPKNVW